METFTGHNESSGPPPFLRYTFRDQDPKRIWRRIHDLELIVPRESSGEIVFDEPVLISQKCIGLSAHSGVPCCVVSRGSKVHVAWAEATDPAEDVPGIPTFVVTYDTETRILGEKALVGYGPPPNDIHNSPSITMDYDTVCNAVRYRNRRLLISGSTVRVRVRPPIKSKA